jgi:hypothetical protein
MPMRTAFLSIFQTLILTLIVFGAHFSLIPLAFHFLDSDTAWMAMESDRFAQLELPVFFNGVWYGGNGLSFFRGFWVWAWEQKLGVTLENLSSYQTGHLIFSYLLSPLLVTASVWFLSGCYFSSRVRFLCTLLSAIGFHHWIFRYGYDWHVLNFVFCCLFLGIKAKHPNPLVSLRKNQLFIVSVLTGFALYNGRTSLLFLVPFWFAFQEAPRVLRDFLTPRNRIENVLRGATFTLLGLFFYLEIFGAEIGVRNGKTIKLHSEPNFDYAVLVFLLWVLMRYSKDLLQKKELLLRGGLGFFGILLGLFPEIFNRFFNPNALTPKSWPNNSFKSFFEIFSTLPEKMIQVIAADPTALRQFSILLFAGTSLYFVYSILTSKKETDRLKFLPVIFCGVLTLYAFCRVQTFSPGSARYLYPLFPIWILAFGFAIEKSRKPVLVFWLFLTFGHFAHHLNARQNWKAELRQNDRVNQLKQVNQVFTDAQLNSILCLDYYHCSTLGFYSSKTLGYLEMGGLYPRYADQFFEKAQKLGLLVNKRERPETTPLTTKVQFKGKDYSTQFLAQVGDFFLFETQK